MDQFVTVRNPRGEEQRYPFWADATGRRSMRISGALAPALLLLSFALRAAGAPATHPPMGWNSWDAYGTTVTEAEVKANADYMAAHLKQHGWEYVVVDIQWSDPNARSHGYRPDAELAMDG